MQADFGLKKRNKNQKLNFFCDFIFTNVDNKLTLIYIKNIYLYYLQFKN